MEACVDPGVTIGCIIFVSLLLCNVPCFNLRRVLLPNFNLGHCLRGRMYRCILPIVYAYLLYVVLRGSISLN